MDGSDEFIDSFLAHFGVKGMKWGVRKDDTARPVTKSRTEPITVKLKSGETLTLDGTRTPLMAKFLAKLSPSIRERVNNSYSFKIKDPEGKPIGEMSLFKESPTSLNVVWVGVDDAHRGKGFATAAMKAAIDQARSMKLDTVTLEVPGHSPDARHIYERLGFKETKTVTEADDDYVWGGLTAMTLDLNDKSIRHADSDGKGLVIVAIPEERDPVWKISSEKIPHLTICYLGNLADNEAVARIALYLQHVAKTSMHRFGLSVKGRGSLGENQADVLFFSENDTGELRDIRSYLLADSDIYNAYHSTEQYAKWLPHLTLGYPETPAKPDTREYPGIGWVNFDRIALWTGDYEGPTFELDREELSMSDPVENVLEHFGVKGMKWGVIRDQKFLDEARLRSKDTFKKGVDDHSDKAKIREFRKQADKSGVRVLGDKDLKALVARTKLENEYHKLRQEEREASRAFVKALWDNFGKEIFGAIVREGIAYKFRSKSSSNSGPSHATVIPGRVLEGATRAISRFPTGK